MKSLVFEEFVSHFPHLDSAAIQDVYKQPFTPELIVECFEGWEHYEAFGRYIDSSEERNILWFDGHSYHLNGQALRRPTTLNEFIRDCTRWCIDLLWKEPIADELFASQYQMAV